MCEVLSTWEAHSRFSARIFIRDRATRLTVLHTGQRIGRDSRDSLQFLETFLLSQLGVATYVLNRSQECC